MATVLHSSRRKALAWTVVVAGCGLIAQQLLFGSSLPDTDVAAEVARERGGAEPRSQQPVLRLDRLDRAASAADDNEPVALFEARPWTPPAAPPPPPAPAPKPVAPPFPYTYIGGLLDGDLRTGFFTPAAGGRVVAVHKGDTLDGVYRVDDMTDTQMTLTYLPLDEAMAVALRSTR